MFEKLRSSFHTPQKTLPQANKTRKKLFRMLKTPHSREVRIYKAVFVVLVVCAIFVLLWALRVSNQTIAKNFEQTQCNQGLLVAALTGVKNEHQLAFCSPEIRVALEKSL